MRLTLLLFIGSIVMTTWSKINIFRTFEINSTKGTFSHMVLDKETGNIYIGAMNSLYHLSSNLTLIKSATTGPKDDSRMCQPQNSTASCNEPKTLMDTYYKALVIDYTNNKLIACSSLYNGICERYNLSDIESKNPDIYDPVVAIDATSTTVAFIAPGPTIGDIQSDVLYVAVSRPNGGQSKFPAIASRKLETFKLVYDGINRNSSKSIQATLRDTFPVHYIYGFSSEKFSYFVTVQKRNARSESFISKLIRVCQADKHYHSYAEVQLKCMHNGTLYNLVQAAYVGKAGSSLATDMDISEDEDVLYVVCSIGNPNTSIPRNYSALCVYPLRKVRQIFTENIKNCFDGIGNTGPSHIILPASCKKTNFTIKDDYCGKYDSNNPIDGQTPIQTEAAITFNTTVSAVAVIKESLDTIAFIGTVMGHVIKVLIKSKHMATSNEDLTVEEGSKINTDMILYKRHLHVLTDRRIYKVQLQECDSYTSCESCVDDENCDWDNYKNTCSVWNIYKERGCVIIHVMPKGEDQFFIPFLSPATEMRECVFSSRNKSIKTRAHINSGGGIRCDIPPSNQLPAIATGEGHILMNVSVVFDMETVSFKTLMLIDCGIPTSCKRCTQSMMYCNWCIRNHTCTIGWSNCPGKTITETELCPRITSNEMEIFVPSETNKKIVVSALNLEDFQTQFNCFFNMEDPKQVNANVTRFLNGTSIIECEIVHFSYAGNANELKVPFHISWDIKNKLDFAEQIQVIMYKCDKMADSCGGCLTLNSQYECGWCDQHCTIKSQCSSTWLSTADTCPNPEIIKIEPTSEIKNGGTYITITGINLGIRFEDISIGVYIENSTRVQCIPLKDLYIAPRRIVCVSGKSNVTGTGKLVVTINKKYNATGSQIFSYVNPVLEEISPFRGPKSGGTLVTLIGNDMNAGNNIKVRIGNHSCEVKSFNSTVLTCVTSMASDTILEKLSVKFDKHMVTSNITYEYTTDPTIINIDPREAIVSGGIRIVVKGTQLNTIKEPKMIIGDANNIYEVVCEVANFDEMYCYSPQIKAIINNDYTSSAMEELYSYGFILDNVTEVLNLTKKDIHKYGTFKIVQDPVFESFAKSSEKAYNYKPDNTLIIKAIYLTGVSQQQVRVKIGNGLCTDVSVANNQITCIPPKDQPKSVNGSANPEVIVFVGRNFSKLVGYLRYDQQEVPVPKTIIIGLTVGVAVVVFIVILVIMIFKKREKNIKKEWQMKMDTLESKVATECKEENAIGSGASESVIDKSTLRVLKDAKLIINIDRLIVGDIIGKGHFGCVLKGYITLPGDKMNILVAIKTLHKKNLRDIDVDAILREIMIMKELHHPNVLRLLGICLGRNDIPIMVLPFMEHGDLLSYIRDDTNIPTVKDLVDFGIGIAEGMAYLSDHKFVHRDLAARNCMLDKELNVKVADFGLSREIYEREYYTSNNKKTKLPIRWMAPESMEKGTYSSKSDVWSYGIVLWELVTRGVTPYYELDNYDIVRYLQKGRRLSQPQYCPDKLYVIMQKCWIVDPNDQPTFTVLAREMTQMLSVAEQDMQQGMLRIDIHHAQFNQADSAKYHYAYDDTYLEPSTSKPIGGANSGNDYMEVFDDTNGVQINPTDGANGNNKNEPYRYAYDDSSLERPTQSESVDVATNNFMGGYDGTNDVQIYLPGGANSNSSHDSCHDERVSFADYTTIKLPENI